jgi:hypothetical protein
MDSSPDNQAALMGQLYSVTQALTCTQDEDYLLDRILSEARKLLSAEAGSIFLVRDGKLHFTYVQNQKLFNGSADLRDSYVQDGKIHFTYKRDGEMADGSADLKDRYLHRPMKIDQSSLAGYVALSGKPLVIEDAHHIPSDAPYHFNKQYDQSTGYRTRSVLVQPLLNGQGRVIGVLQLINALDGAGQVKGFSPEDVNLAGFFANSAALALERAMITRELILRMMRMAELRDPKETGTHVNRVGGYAAVIYEAWGTSQGLPSQEVSRNQDLIRVAAMLHDVGKVAISDTILKKPGRLDEDEYHTMKFHTVRGAQLFGAPSSEMDRLAQQIVLRHHERWDGKGYPGHIDDLHTCQTLGPGQKGEETPIAARITALADVYDALMSKRVYKEAWPEEKALGIIKEERGSQFDPLVVDAFFTVYDEIDRVRRLYAENDS